MEEINRTELGQTWEQIEKIAQDRRKWKFFVIDLHVCPGLKGLKGLSQVKYRYMYMHMHDIV